MAVGCSYCWRTRRVSASFFDEAPRVGGTLRFGTPLRIVLSLGSGFTEILNLLGMEIPTHQSCRSPQNPPWIAVSRRPYLTALALWRSSCGERSRSIFIDNCSVLIEASGREHPGHPFGPLHVVEYSSLTADDPLHNAVPGWRNGWEGAADAQRKSSGALILERNSKISTTHFGCRYSLHSTDGHLIAKFRAHWADFDQEGRLVATVNGHVLTGEITKNHNLQWRQLAAMEDEQPTLMEAPAWAQTW